MLLLKYLLLFTGWGLLIAAAANFLRNLYQVVQYHRQLRHRASATEPPSTNGVTVEKPQLNWTTAKWAFLAAWLPLIIAAGIVVLYDIRDQVLTTSSSGKDGLQPASEHAAERKESGKPEAFTVQSKEGLSIGLAITVRYRLDPRKLDYIHANLPQPVEKEIVPPVVSSVFRELAPNYTVREVFATRREEIRRNAAERITQKLDADGIIVKEVMLRDVQLPEEYAKGLEGLLLKEQQNEGMGVETEMKAKQVKIAELEAEAARVRQVKQAQGAGEVRVLQAKSEADAMQFTLPLKQKQIEQSRLEAEAQKETTVKNAEAQAQAKVIDSKAEMERRELLADAEAGRIRKVAVADAERMKSEAAVLKQNPLLINKIIAERLSDKLQIMMVPADGKFFFANDVLRSMSMANRTSQAEESEDPPQK